jgi:hypothetical protein
MDVLHFNHRDFAGAIIFLHITNPTDLDFDFHKLTNNIVKLFSHLQKAI